VIAISSFRPFEKCSDEIKDNQIKAFRSWLPNFERIVLFGHPSPLLSSCLSQFIPCEGKPQVKTLAETLGQFEGWSCVVNADIVVSAKITQIQQRLHQSQCQCAVSKRWDMQSLQTDGGLDWFAALPDVWKKVAQSVPPSFCVGRSLWDTWLASFFGWEYGGAAADCTDLKFIWHPRHGERVDQSFDAPPPDKYLKDMHWPMTVL
jgi:hypothetical protein